MKTVVIMKDIYAEQIRHLEKGPRNKSEATFDLEKIVLAFLNASDHVIEVFYNGRQELEVKIDDDTYNLTQILEHAGFEHLEFDANELDDYVLFLRATTTKNQPHLDDEPPELSEQDQPTELTEKLSEKVQIIELTEELSEQVQPIELAEEVSEQIQEEESEKKKDDFPDQKDFRVRDPAGTYDDLSYAEKLAINVYTTTAYRDINAFLRSSGQGEKLRKLSAQDLAQQIKEYILASCIAAHGLNKINIVPVEGGDEPAKLQKLNRFEKKDDMEEVFKERVKDIKKKNKEKKQQSFTSSSLKDDTNFSKYDTYVTIYQPFGINPLGKKVDLLADLVREKEVLFIPGTQFKFFDYRKKEGRHYFSAVPVRSLEGAAASLTYSTKNIVVRDQFIKLHKDFAEAINAYQREVKQAPKSFFSTTHFSSSDKILKKIDGLVDFLEVSNPLDRASYFARLQALKKVISEELIKASKIDSSKSNKHIKAVGSMMMKINQHVDGQIQLVNKGLSENIDPIRLLADMKKLDKGIRAQIVEKTDAVANIKKIKAICDDRYTDQVYYGNAALNRKILLDKDIADLLTPETIALIFDEHQQLKKQGKLDRLGADDNIALVRLGKEEDKYISLGDALFFGFNDGLDVIKHLPNNDKKYGPDQYENQKQSFTGNTTRIVENLLKASLIFGLIPTATKYKLQETGNHFLPLSKRFAQIEMVIGLIKKDGQGDKLVFVPGFKPTDIRIQCVRGFRSVCLIKEEEPNICVVVEKGIKSLNDLAIKFVSDPKLLLNGSISHLVYDRVHFEACLEQNTILRIGEKDYTLADFFREVVKLCVSSPDYYIAHEQFALRMGLIEAHLQEKFPKQWTQGGVLVNKPPEHDVLNLLTM